MSTITICLYSISVYASLLGQLIAPTYAAVWNVNLHPALHFAASTQAATDSRPIKDPYTPSNTVEGNNIKNIPNAILRILICYTICIVDILCGFSILINSKNKLSNLHGVIRCSIVLIRTVVSKLSDLVTKIYNILISNFILLLTYRVHQNSEDNWTL